jgi:3-mercaptopyruvate sulfurtransferase SseA
MKSQTYTRAQALPEILKNRIAILDGTLTAGFSAEELSHAPLAPPADGSWRFPELATPRFELLATIEDVKAQQDRSGPLLDLRPQAEFDGSAISLSGHDDTCLLGAPACTAVRGGRIRGATRLPLEAIGDPATLRWSTVGVMAMDDDRERARAALEVLDLPLDVRAERLTPDQSRGAGTRSL